MKILMTGGTGLIGSTFINKFSSKYHFDVLSRQTGDLSSRFGNEAKVNVISSLNYLKHLDDYQAVINLAGEPIAEKRWSQKQKHSICHSRWNLTSQLSKLINDSTTPPNTFISGSAVGFYGRQGNETITEQWTDVYPEFSHTICKVWEEKAWLSQHKSRVCILRTGIVLDKNKGALKKMLPAFKFGLGGRFSTGTQFMSWIHIDDMVNAIEFLLNNQQCQGQFNLTAPKPVTNKEFCQILAKTLRRPNLATMPAFVLRILFGEMADLFLYGQKVVPEKLLSANFKFTHPNLQSALHHLLKS
ncbi:TIGR01777 family oxidoreductase [Thalassotalea sp. ND16A]|uniref:TIGR01777 family oxidoreductase n=1 Tax=Thalassotalea sp. ND16A TaxID=1535422 RepID=UPI00051A8105|nr:TIGR01777 family oxidoreductase [Thalassotalea sp. ND16A]KGK00127.1 hypothetical protein ND16A_0318 [Thalassotalea sp. ND16A]